MRKDLVIAIHNRRDLDKAERACLLSLAIHMNSRNGKCDPSIQRLVDTTGFSRSSVSAALNRLKERRILEIRKRFQKASQFVIRFGANDPAPGPMKGAAGGNIGPAAGPPIHPRIGPEIEKKSESEIARAREVCRSLQEQLRAPYLEESGAKR